MKPISDYNNDAARLQASVASFAATVCIQEKAFIVDVNSNEGNLSSIKSSGQATFRVALESPVFNGFCRIRLKRMRFVNLFTIAAFPNTA